MRAIVAAGCILFAQSFQHCDAASAVREGFEGGTINRAFEQCNRPENSIAITTQKARSGSRSLKLEIHSTPLFERQKRPLTMRLNPETCLLTGSESMYWNDENERAELWETKTGSPTFGDDIYYGFSMWVDRASAPVGDFNRMVAGQWKAKNDNSPFLAQRFTGGFYHISLDVDAVPSSQGDLAPHTCKVLLAFVADKPSATEEMLRLDRPTQCEERLQYQQNSVTPANPLKVDRKAYLPSPYGRWTDLVLHIKGGRKGIVRLWADGQLIATAQGTIGHMTGIGQVQYFKFGPYRDPAGYSSVFYIDNLSRGPSYEDVDPAKQ